MLENSSQFAQEILNFKNIRAIDIFLHTTGFQPRIMTSHEIYTLFKSLEILHINDYAFYCNNDYRNVYIIHGLSERIEFLKYFISILHTSHITVLFWYINENFLTQNSLTLISENSDHILKNKPITLKKFYTKTIKDIDEIFFSDLQLLGLCLTSVKDIEMLPSILKQNIQSLLIVLPYSLHDFNYPQYIDSYAIIINSLPVEELIVTNNYPTLRNRLYEVFIPYTERENPTIMKPAI